MSATASSPNNNNRKEKKEVKPNKSLHRVEVRPDGQFNKVQMYIQYFDNDDKPNQSIQ